MHTDDKEGAGPTYKKGYGSHPLLCYCDEIGEALAGKLRPGPPGASTAAGHIELLDQAVAQLPVPTKQDDPENGLDVLAQAGSAGATIDWAKRCPFTETGRVEIRVTRIPFRVPERDELADRLPAVLRTLYVIFTEGYAASAGQELM